MLKLTRTILLLITLAGSVSAKKKVEPLTLADRYDRASCAVVQIIHDEGIGTGFFINDHGDVLTASHVALNRSFSEPTPGQLRVDIDYKPGLRVVPHGQAVKLLALPRLDPADIQRSLADLVVLRTGINSPCFLSLATHLSDKRIGQHVIAIGYPISAPTGALYEGFISATYTHLPTPLAVVNGRPIFPTYEVIRVQMPITPGASGGPVIVDDGEVIGVVSENPTAWFNDLNAIIKYGQEQSGGFNAPVSDLPKIVAKLAWVVQEFVTSGAGLAVPVSYLGLPYSSALQTPQPKTKDPEPQSRLGRFLSLLDHLK